MTFTLTQKERMLLEDAKNHELLCIEKYSRYANQVQDQQFKQICKANEQSERTHLDTINQLLSGTIPQMNQQQNGNQQNQTAPAQGNQIACAGMSEKDICQDLLSTEKYVSGTYDTAIFEFRNTQVRDILNHIQKEEQQHGDAIFKYMESKGLYQVQ